MLLQTYYANLKELQNFVAKYCKLISGALFI